MRRVTLLLSLLAMALGKELNIQLEHSLDGATFTKAGFLQGDVFDTSMSRGEHLTLIRSDLTLQDQEKLADLVQHNEVYKVRIASDPSSENSPKISTSIPARCLVSSGMQDHLQIHAAPNGRFIGINYDYARHPCSPEAEVQVPSELSFPESSSVAVWMPVSVPILRKGEAAFAAGKGKPSKAGGQQSIAGKSSQGEKEAPVEDNRPWIMKNWMIALPIAFVAMNVLGAVMGPQDSGAAPAAAAPAASGRRR